MIAIRNVSKLYGDRPVVDAVTLDLPRGGLTAIVGPNGAGKSTLLSMIARLMPMSSGSVTVDRLDVTTTASDLLARRLSILKQENHVTARVTVRDLVSFGRYPHSKGRLTQEDRRQVDEAIDYLGLRELAGRFLDELSGGQRQRAFVAMTLAQNTDYMLFDEPLNNLDMKHAVSMMKLLGRAAGDLGKTVVAVLHDINFAATYASHIVAMQNGRVVRQGRPEEIVRPDVLEEIFGTPFEVHAIGGRRIAVYY